MRVLRRAIDDGGAAAVGREARALRPRDVRALRARNRNGTSETSEQSETGGSGAGARGGGWQRSCAREIGGMNSLEPLRAAALLGLPVLDVDWMGRAFPQLQMCTPFIYGENPLPCALSGEYGSVYVTH